MQERLSRIEARVEKKRATITSVMEKADIKKLEQPDFTASLRAVPPGLVVSDADSDDFGRAFRADVGHLFRLMPAGASD